MLDGIPIANLTAASLLGIAVLMVFLGYLIPRATYKEKAAESDRWQKAYEAERKARVESDAQTRELLELAKLTHSVIVAAFEATGDPKKSGGAHVVPTKR